MVSVDFDGAGFARRWAAAVDEPPLERRILRSVLICAVFFYSVTANAYGRKKSSRLGREHVSEALVNRTHCRFLRHRAKLFELQEWLGYRLPSSTQRYAKITPTKLVKSYSDAGYFRRNLRVRRRQGVIQFHSTHFSSPDKSAQTDNFFLLGKPIVGVLQNCAAVPISWNPGARVAKIAAFCGSDYRSRVEADNFCCPSWAQQETTNGSRSPQCQSALNRNACEGFGNSSVSKCVRQATRRILLRALIPLAGVVIQVRSNGREVPIRS